MRTPYRIFIGLMVACVLGSTATAETPGVSGGERTATPCLAAMADMALDLGAVMHAITHCREELELSDAQRALLADVTATFVDGVMKREALRETAEDELTMLLRPDASDPGRPVDFAASEARIREIERIAAEHDVAALRAVEASKALLTVRQRAQLAALLAASRGDGSPRLEL